MRLVCILSFLISISSAGQKHENYYDYNWKACEPGDARFYCTVEKTDSGWLRLDYYLSNMQLQMQALYEDAACKSVNGYAFYYHPNGRPSTLGRMLHNKQQGICVRYYSNGMMADSAMYHNGIPAGSRIMWHRNGYMSDSIVHVNDSMNVHYSWFDNGSISFAGYLLKEKKHGKWKYFHRNGSLAGELVFDKGEIVSVKYYNDDGTGQADTSRANSDAVFKNGGTAGWAKYMEKNLYWPPGFAIKNTNRVVVVVSFVVDEEGRVQDAEVTVPFHKEFDSIALRIIKNSPAWKPAIAQNRKVKNYFRQPVTFQQDE
jgi:TonB family protein